MQLSSSNMFRRKWLPLFLLLFLVLFSYAFFFEGYTGMVVTVGAIITLAVLMHVTAKVDWGEAFRNKQSPVEPT